MSDILASPSDMPRGVRGVAPPEENCPISLPLHRTCPGGYGGSPPRKKTVRYLCLSIGHAPGGTGGRPPGRKLSDILAIHRTLLRGYGGQWGGAGAPCGNSVP